MSSINEILLVLAKEIAIESEDVSFLQKKLESKKAEYNLLWNQVCK